MEILVPLNRFWFTVLCVFINFMANKKLYLSATSKDDHKEVQRIVGGELCTIEQYPFLVSIFLRSDSMHFCGGTLISGFWVLTSAYCCSARSAPAFGIALGSSHVSKPAKMVKVIVHIAHPEFKLPSIKHNIGLMKLEEAVAKTDRTSYVTLPVPYNPRLPAIQDICDNGMVMGWGSLDPSGMQPSDPIPHLHCAQLSVQSYKVCSKFSDDVPTQFCAHSDGKGACEKDSGSPMMCSGSQYGVVSGIFGCGDKNYPGLYTRVDFYIEFIDRTIGSDPRSYSLNNYPNLLVVFVLVSLVSFNNV